LEFKSEVKAVQLRRDRLVVVLLSKVFAYTFGPEPMRLCAFETCDNPQGLVALCAASDNRLLAFPGRLPGHVHLADLSRPSSNTSRPASAASSNEESVKKLSSSPTTVLSGHIPELKHHPEGPSSEPFRLQTSIITAHSSALACICLNQQGTLLATASVKGTLVRVFDTHTGRIIRELRRGADMAIIYSISFSADGRWLCVGSDKGTVHIYSLEHAQSQPAQQIEDSYQDIVSPGPVNRQSSLHFIKDLLPKYFSSEWSFATCHVRSDVRFLCTFAADMKSIIVITMDGSYYQFSFDSTAGGECPRELYHRFLDLDDD
jgi:WD repeat-containing protein 45